MTTIIQSANLLPGQEINQLTVKSNDQFSWFTTPPIKPSTLKNFR